MHVPDLFRVPLVLLAGIGLAQPAAALSPSETDPRVIMSAVEERATGDRQLSRMQITIRDKAGRERTRVVQGRTMDFDGGTRQLIFFESPADVRNAGMLSVDYDDGDATDDQWLYLPSLKKTTRISSSDKSGSFMGTDLTYSDMTRKDPAAYDYVLVEANAEVNGEACWLIEARPRTEKEKSETGYLKSHVWISKSKLMVVQNKSWVIVGKKLKYTRFTDIKEVNGVQIAHTLTVRTMRNGAKESESILQFIELKLDDADISESDFTEQRLEQGL